MEKLISGDLVEIRLPWWSKLRAKLRRLELPGSLGIFMTYSEDPSACDVIFGNGDAFSINKNYVKFAAAGSDRKKSENNES